MAGIALNTFSGLFPRVSPRLIPQNAATIAENVRLDSGRISSWRGPLAINDHNSASFVVPSNTKTIYKHRDRAGNGYWLVWSSEVNAIPSPIAEDPYDRLYWTGETYPRMAIGTEVAGSVYPNYAPSASRKLGVPAPSVKPTVAVTGGTPGENATALSRAYIYTYVSGIGEEGPPSPSSDIIEAKQGHVVTVTFTDTVPSHIYNTGPKPALRRIYRTNSTGDYQFVKDVLASASSTTESFLDEELGELLPTSLWEPPPDEVTADHPDGPMQGLIQLPNGISAGFAGRSVFFSESYLPHAFPSDYAITVKSKIVGLISVSIGMIALTQGKPVLFTGSSGGGMSANEIDSNQSCASAKSIADMGGVAIYASPDGLVMAGENGVSLVTEGIFTRDQWQALNPSSILGFHYEGRYIFFYKKADNSTGGYVLDPRGEAPQLTTLGFYASAGFNDPVDDALYLVVTDVDGTKVRKFDGGSALTWTWQSKELRLESPINPGAAMIDAEAYPVTFQLYADGALKHTKTVSNGDIFRLPAGYLAKKFQVKLSGAVEVNSVAVVESPSEIG